LRCWFGEWSGGSSTGFGLPKCVGNPCELPEITGGEGKYIGSGGSYRPGIHYTSVSQPVCREILPSVPPNFFGPYFYYCFVEKKGFWLQLVKLFF